MRISVVPGYWRRFTMCGALKLKGWLELQTGEF